MMRTTALLLFLGSQSISVLCEQNSASVIIKRDKFGVPHILALTEAAAAYAHGYVTAEDHGETLSALFLRAQGRQAEIFGESTYASDVLVHELGIPEGAERQWAAMPPLMKGILQGYADGYNRYLGEHPDQFPDWAKPVSGADVLAHCRAVLLLDFTLDLQGWASMERANAPPGSNMWAIGRVKSSTGNGLLLINPHLGWSGSHLLQEAHLRVSGRIDIYGFAFVGSPVVVMGFNQHMGWAHTVNRPDSDDVYELAPDPGDDKRYLYEGVSLPLHKRDVAIRVRTDSGVQIRTITVYSSHHGPVRWKDGRQYALRSANLEDLDFLSEWNAMGKASNFEEFRRALDKQALPAFNIAWTDRAGRVYYLFNGRIPERPDGYDWRGVVPGDTSTTEWSAMYPVASLPQLLNPPSGYVQNSNGPPWFANLGTPIPPASYPKDIANGDLDLRSQVSLAILERHKRFTLADMLEEKNNDLVLLAERLKPDLIKIGRRASSHTPAFREAIDLLSHWNNHATAASTASTLFLRWWERYAALAKPVFKREWLAQAPVSTPSGIGDPEAALKALRSTIDALQQEYGMIAVPYGEVHRFRKGQVDLPLAGATGTTGIFRVILFGKDTDGRMRAMGGDSCVLGVEFARVPIAHSVCAYSQSSRPTSRHYNDQAELFASGRYKRVAFTDEEIDANLEDRYLLSLEHK